MYLLRLLVYYRGSLELGNTSEGKERKKAPRGIDE